MTSPALGQEPPEPSSQETQTTFLPHRQDARWWLSGQLNLIGQAHGSFRSPYDGDHSLRATPERALSRVWTIYTGWQLARATEVMFDLESAGGRGISDALGLAGFTNLDVVRNPDLGSAPYVARAMIRQVIPLTKEMVDTARGPFAIARREPARRIELRAGKISMPDFFDVNGPGSDSHLQFTNWTVDNNGAYDYAADTRGYTVGMVAELITPRWTIRGGEAVMPTVANGIHLDWDMTRSRATNVEFEAHVASRLISRTLAYLNHANMGSYEEAIAGFHGGIDPVPDIERHRRQGRTKFGVGENVEYTVSRAVRVFGRGGWNDGRNESFAYTEVDSTMEAGADLTGVHWRRPVDRVGLAVVSNGLSDVHREYLRLGGRGFLLGDGTLTYGRETIVEGYYTAHLWLGLFASIGAEHIVHPGYNRDRGPVTVGTIRVHADF